MYDIIGDIHADYNRLKNILIKLKYKFSHKGWFHPDGRVAIFLGDIIDGGSDNYLVYKLIREMVECGNALCIMGNHEFNAIMFHNFDDNGNPFREHSEKNIKQHSTFLKESPVGSSNSIEIIEWFMTLPLYIDLEEFRVVHACWHNESILNIRNCVNLSLKRECLQNAADVNDFFRVSIDTILNGLEDDLPNGNYFYDIYGTQRNKFRYKWWTNKRSFLHDVIVSAGDLSNIENHPIHHSMYRNVYEENDKPLFFGHYKLQGNPIIEQKNVLCLDYPGTPIAYRWDKGDKEILTDKIIFV